MKKFFLEWVLPAVVMVGVILVVLAVHNRVDIPLVDPKVEG